MSTTKELRSMAESVGLAMPQAATLMMGAADTIWELRNKCADLVDERERLFRANVEKNNKILRLVGENARLREELADAPKCETCEAMLDCDECLRADGSHKERRRLSAENAKLLELVKDIDEVADPFLWEFIGRRMRELGIEVR